MQELVNKIYSPKPLDSIAPISRLEFEQRDIRSKLDTPDIYLKLTQMENTLKENGIALEPIPEHEDTILDMVMEERKAFQIDWELQKRKMRQTPLKARLLQNFKRKFYGLPSLSKEDFSILSELSPSSPSNDFIVDDFSNNLPH